MCKCAVAVLAILMGGGLVLRADGPVTPAKELIQYVSDAKRQGLKEDAIRKNALAAGWPADAVAAALAYEPSKAESSKTDASYDHGSPFAVPAAAGATAESTATPGEPKVQKDRGVPDDYQIGAGDILQINVWKEPDASVPSVVVRPDGKISMPLLKEIEVAGQTPTELERSITGKLAKFMNAADVTVMVTAINSKKVYIVGGARREGPLPYTYRMTVMQAISEAGGLNDYAKRKKIYVLRTDNGKEYRMLFNYNQALKGEKMEQNIQLLPGDTVVIPQ